jgi:hypothetical protein
MIQTIDDMARRPFSELPCRGIMTVCSLQSDWESSPMFSQYFLSQEIKFCNIFCLKSFQSWLHDSQTLAAENTKSLHLFLASVFSIATFSRANVLAFVLRFILSSSDQAVLNLLQDYISFCLT